MSQVFEEALVAQLRGIANLTAYVGTSIYKSYIPQTHDLGAQGPALVYSVPTKPMGHVLTGSDGTAVATAQIDLWSYSYATAKRAVEALWHGLDFAPATWGDGTVQIMSVVQQNESDLPQEPQAATDQWTYLISCEYRVQYRVSFPVL